MILRQDSSIWFNGFRTTPRPNIERNSETKYLFKTFPPYEEHCDTMHSASYERDEPSDWEDYSGNFCQDCETYEEQWTREEWVFAIACLLVERAGRISIQKVHDKINDNRDNELDLEEWMEDTL